MSNPKQKEHGGNDDDGAKKAANNNEKRSPARSRGRPRSTTKDNNSNAATTTKRDQNPSNSSTTSVEQQQQRKQIHPRPQHNDDQVTNTTTKKRAKHDDSMDDVSRTTTNGSLLTPRTEVVEGDNNTTKWEHMYFLLGVFRQTEGHCNVTLENHHQTPPILAHWVNTQRTNKRRKKLSQDQIAALNALGFIWNRQEEEYLRQWEERFQQLVEYKRIHNTTSVPVKEETGLGEWVSRQRTAQVFYERKRLGRLEQGFKKHRIMTDEHRVKLDSIGFIWSVSKGWDGMYDELCKYQTKFGNCSVPQHWKEIRGLGKWVARQRYNYCLIQQGKTEKNPLTPDRIEKLNAIGFHWGKLRPNLWKAPQTEEAKEKVEESRYLQRMQGSGAVAAISESEKLGEETHDDDDDQEDDYQEDDYQHATTEGESLVL